MITYNDTLKYIFNTYYLSVIHTFYECKDSTKILNNQSKILLCDFTQNYLH